MAELTSAERVMRALCRKEPDRVPHFEWSVAQPIREALVPGCKTEIEFAARIGYDAIIIEPDFKIVRVSPTRWLTEWGYRVEYGAEEYGIAVTSPVKTLADLERLTPPDPNTPERYATLDWVVREFKGHRAIGVHLNDVLSIPRNLMGMENLMVALIDDPPLIQALVELSVNFNLAMAKQVAARGADFVYTGDDFAHKYAPLMSPKHFRQFFYPGFVKVVRGLKELGLAVIKHSDGNLWSLLDMIVDAGIDCLDPIEPQAGMNLAEVKAKYGHRIALKGNVDCAQTLTFGSVDTVVVETKAALRDGARGGGFILSSSNSIHAAVKPENYLALLQTWRKYGQYPIAL